MSTFKVALISGVFAIVLFAFTGVLSVVSGEPLFITFILMFLAPSITKGIEYFCKNHQERKVWNALALAGLIAPCTWFVVVLVSLINSDI
jgi:hypothetical protein